MKRATSILLLLLCGVIFMTVSCDHSSERTPPTMEEVLENQQFVPGKPVGPPKGCKDMRERAERAGKEAHC